MILLTDGGRKFIVAELDNFEREIELMRLLDQRGQEQGAVRIPGRGTSADVG